MKNRRKGDQMNRLTIHNHRCNNTTLISNRFIDYYMKEANDAQLKIYLYLVRMMNANICTSISEIADKFNHTEKDVIRALRYWEAKHLLSLELNDNGALVGISLKELKEHDSVPIDNSNHDSTQELPTVTASHTSEIAASEVSAKVVSPPAESTPFSKETYSLDQLKSFKNSEDAAQILFIAEQYLGKTLTPIEVRTIYYLYDHLHFSPDLIDYLIQYCVERGKKDFRYIESVALNWAEQGILTPEQAAEQIHTYDKSVYSVMKALGKSNTPTNAEMDFIKRWKTALGLPLEIVIEACNRSVLATDNHRFEYADSILKNWHKQNVHTMADVEECDRNYMKAKNVTPIHSANTKSQNKFNQFAHNTYNFDELEQKLIQN